MCHEDDAIMHEVVIMHKPQASALCNQVHYCIIRVCHIKRRKLNWACHKCAPQGGGGGGGGGEELVSPQILAMILHGTKTVSKPWANGCTLSHYHTL